MTISKISKNKYSGPLDQYHFVLYWHNVDNLDNSHILSRLLKEQISTLDINNHCSECQAALKKEIERYKSSSPKLNIHLAKQESYYWEK